jgi:cyclopropane-fatty-acyl-phospholipid synthase
MTVTDWLANFEAHFDQAVALVGIELARVWRLYLIGGRLSFEEGRMGLDQILASRPAALDGHG